MPIGNPVTLTSNVASKAISVTATASQTLFNVTGGYRINELGVFKNGLRLQDGVDYTARDGLTVTLLSAASGGDKLQFVVFDTFRVAEAIRPAVDEQTIRGNLNVVGILSCTDLEGPVSLNITSGIQTFHDVRVGGALTVAGTLTYEDTTNTNTTGIATFSGGMNISGVGATATTLNVTGVSTFGGIVSIGDSIFHTGDTNSAFGFPAADTFTVYTAGSERLRITSAGRIGVGLDNPSTTLHLSTSDPRITITDSDAGENFVIRNTSGAGYLTVGDHPLLFYTNGNERLRIFSGGQVAIATATNYGNANCDDLIVGNRNSNEQGITIGAKNQGQIAFADLAGDRQGLIHYQHTDDSMRFMTNGAANERMRIASDGNVSIGGTEGITYSLLKGLAINVDNGDAGIIVNSSSSAHNAYISFGYGDSGAVSHADQFSAYIGRVGDDTLALGTGNNIRVYIDSSGRVIIADSDADNASTSADDLIIGNTNQRSGLTIVSGNTNDGNIFFSDGTATGNANVQGQIVYHHNDHELKFYVAAGKKLTIDQGGGVNISGITTATQLFEGTTRVATTGKAIAMAMLFG